MRKSIVLILLAIAVGASADIRLPALFADDAVLQQGTQVPVWGWAEEGEQVTVTFQGQEVSTTTAKDGAWRVNLNKCKTGGPFEMIIAGNNTLMLTNLLVGEVWVCGGQSNMQWPVSKCATWKAAIRDSANPNIRLFQVKVTGADTPQTDVEAQWKPCGPDTVPNFTGVGYFFGRALHENLDVPIGLIQSCLGGTNASCWTTKETLTHTPELKSFVDDYAKVLENYPETKRKYDEQCAKHKAKLAKAKAEGRKLKPAERRAPRSPMGPDHVKRPSALYNAMIAPLKPYAIQGAIWYQGESNAHTPETALQYRDLFPAMIADWREGWECGAFPFLFVQLASYARPQGEAWPLLREAQTKTLSLKNTGMAVITDLGEQNDIHPPRKQPVGERLALAARHVAYGEKLVYAGPMFKKMKIKRGKARIAFDHAGGGLVSKGGELKGFTIAGADRQFVEAEARIKGNSVVVSNPEVKKPVAVRYAWLPYPECNLYNEEGLPANPFRTDTFPPVE